MIGPTGLPRCSGESWELNPTAKRPHSCVHYHLEAPPWIAVVRLVVHHSRQSDHRNPASKMLLSRDPA